MPYAPRSKRTLAFARNQSAALRELPEPGPHEDTIPDYPSDATTRILRTDLLVHGPARATRDNSHLLPSVIVESEPGTQPMPRPVPSAPASHVRPVERNVVTRRVGKMPNLALMALLISVGALVARMLPVLGRWIEAVLGG